MSPAYHNAGATALEETHQTRKLVPLFYGELRHLAAQMLARRPPGQTLQDTDLVHEAFLRLVQGRDQTWHNHAHFLGAAIEAMRRILIEEARRKMTQRRGGNWERVSLDDVEVAVDTDPGLLLTINDALDRLAVVDPVKAQVVKLRFFAGLSIEEVGRIMGLAERTVKWHWAFAKAWLYHEISRTR